MCATFYWSILYMSSKLILLVTICVLITIVLILFLILCVKSIILDCYTFACTHKQVHTPADSCFMYIYLMHMLFHNHVLIAQNRWLELHPKSNSQPNDSGGGNCCLVPDHGLVLTSFQMLCESIMCWGQLFCHSHDGTAPLRVHQLNLHLMLGNIY